MRCMAIVAAGFVALIVPASAQDSRLKAADGLHDAGIDPSAAADARR